jgi:hypothetical protein
MTSKCVCAQSVNKITTVRNLNKTRIFVNEVENSIWEKPLQGSRTQDIHYLEDKTNYKVVALTYPWCSGLTLHSKV